MTRQIKATQLSLLVHAMFFLTALAISQHAPPVRLPVALDFSILPAAGPPVAGPPQEAPAAPPAPQPPAPVERKIQPKPVVKQPPPKPKKTVEAKKTPVETVPVATSVPQEHPQESLSPANTATASAGASSANPVRGEGARGGGGGIYAVGQLDGPLSTLAKAPPVYPPAAKRRNIEGWIKVKFVVDEQGQVDKVSVLAAEPEGVFDQAVLRCISGWRFKPGTKGGIAVKALVEQTITFKLEG